ncbi:unnamed protein product [Phytophthora fragariaefolia]|uniref:Unnamed protein product n=1 Tax=Phytophthora fragariaefolia TaxID=1490495 RepID=A0A9W6YBX3_9STRA|nr:unnamed protein product [Phytophthora fragariaefolia]
MLAALGRTLAGWLSPADLATARRGSESEQVTGCRDWYSTAGGGASAFHSSDPENRGQQPNQSQLPM